MAENFFQGGIEHEYNIPKTLEQDGVAECVNRTLVEVVRGVCLLILSHRFWAEALSTAAYLINRSPTKALSDMTPFESWFEKKPNMKNLSVFGCAAYTHVPKEMKERSWIQKQSVAYMVIQHNEKIIGSTI